MNRPAAIGGCNYQSIRLRWHDWFVWGVLGALLAINFRVSGDVYVGEIVATVMLFPLLLRQRLSKELGWLLVACAVFGLAQLISDLYNRTPFISSVKGVGAPLFFGVTILFLYTLFKSDTKRMYPMLAGIALAQIVQIWFWPTEYQQVNAWKFGYGSLVLTLILIGFAVRKGEHLAWLLAALGAFALVSILNDARSLAGLPLIGFASVIAWRSPGSAFKAWLLRGHAPIKMLLFVVPGVILANESLGWIFNSDILRGVLDPAGIAKYRLQGQSDVGLLLAGRSEWLVSINAFLDAPMLGHGSWPVDKHGYLAQYAALRFKYGISEIPIVDQTTSLIPSHSFLMGAMVWAGISGGVFWMFFAYRIASRFLGAAAKLPAYFHVGTMFFFWNLLFSPFGAVARWGTAVFIASLLAATSSGIVRRKSMRTSTKRS